MQKQCDRIGDQKEDEEGHNLENVRMDFGRTFSFGGFDQAQNQQQQLKKQNQNKNNEIIEEKENDQEQSPEQIMKQKSMQNLISNFNNNNNNYVQNDKQGVLNQNIFNLKQNSLSPNNLYQQKQDNIGQQSMQNSQSLPNLQKLQFQQQQVQNNNQNQVGRMSASQNIQGHKKKKIFDNIDNHFRNSTNLSMGRNDENTIAAKSQELQSVGNNTSPQNNFNTHNINDDQIQINARNSSIAAFGGNQNDEQKQKNENLQDISLLNQSNDDFSINYNNMGNFKEKDIIDQNISFQDSLLQSKQSQQNNLNLNDSQQNLELKLDQMGSNFKSDLKYNDAENSQISINVQDELYNSSQQNDLKDLIFDNSFRNSYDKNISPQEKNQQDSNFQIVNNASFTRKRLDSIDSPVNDKYADYRAQQQPAQQQNTVNNQQQQNQEQAQNTNNQSTANPKECFVTPQKKIQPQSQIQEESKSEIYIMTMDNAVRSGLVTQESHFKMKQNQKEQEYKVQQSSQIQEENEDDEGENSGLKQQTLIDENQLPDQDIIKRLSTIQEEYDDHQHSPIKLTDNLIQQHSSKFQNQMKSEKSDSFQELKNFEENSENNSQIQRLSIQKNQSSTDNTNFQQYQQQQLPFDDQVSPFSGKMEQKQLLFGSSVQLPGEINIFKKNSSSVQSLDDNQLSSNNANQNQQHTLFSNWQQFQIKQENLVQNGDSQNKKKLRRASSDLEKSLSNNKSSNHNNNNSNNKNELIDLDNLEYSYNNSSGRSKKLLFSNSNQKARSSSDNKQNQYSEYQPQQFNNSNGNKYNSADNNSNSNNNKNNNNNYDVDFKISPQTHRIEVQDFDKLDDSLQKPLNKNFKNIDNNDNEDVDIDIDDNKENLKNSGNLLNQDQNQQQQQQVLKNEKNQDESPQNENQNSNEDFQPRLSILQQKIEKEKKRQERKKLYQNIRESQDFGGDSIKNSQNQNYSEVKQIYVQQQIKNSSEENQQQQNPLDRKLSNPVCYMISDKEGAEQQNNIYRSSETTQTYQNPFIWGSSLVLNSQNKPNSYSNDDQKKIQQDQQASQLHMIESTRSEYQESIQKDQNQEDQDQNSQNQNAEIQVDQQNQQQQKQQSQSIEINNNSSTINQEILTQSDKNQDLISTNYEEQSQHLKAKKRKQKKFSQNEEEFDENKNENENNKDYQNQDDDDDDDNNNSNNKNIQQPIDILKKSSEKLKSVNNYINDNNDNDNDNIDQSIDYDDLEKQQELVKQQLEIENQKEQEELQKITRPSFKFKKDIFQQNQEEGQQSSAKKNIAEALIQQRQSQKGESDVLRQSIASACEDEVVYQLDENGYLIDEQGNYILDDDGNMIQLTEEHIEYLKESEILEDYTDQ